MHTIKRAFPGDRTDGIVVVAYDMAAPGWRLSVSDNGIGKPEGDLDRTIPGLGTTIIEALAKQLDARTETVTSTHGRTVSIIHGAAEAASGLIGPPECGHRGLIDIGRRGEQCVKSQRPTFTLCESGNVSRCAALPYTFPNQK